MRVGLGKQNRLHYLFTNYLSNYINRNQTWRKSVLHNYSFRETFLSIQLGWLTIWLQPSSERVFSLKYKGKFLICLWFEIVEIEKAIWSSKPSLSWVSFSLEAKVERTYVNFHKLGELKSPLKNLCGKKTRKSQLCWKASWRWLIWAINLGM